MAVARFLFVQAPSTEIRGGLDQGGALAHIQTAMQWRFEQNIQIGDQARIDMMRDSRIDDSRDEAHSGILGPGLHLPVVPFRNILLPPGPWANFLQELDFTNARRCDRNSTDNLDKLKDMQLQREFMVRHGRVWTTRGMVSKLNRGVEKVESALCFVVGVIKYGNDRCKRCQEGLGPFTFCVQIIGAPYFTACACCHFNKDSQIRRKRMEKNPQPLRNIILLGQKA
ncbi:hypothetical protein N7488_006516 [Penicillium malachiteum]|nr:hypothetical protein N7488_006516 [Penicillium malachiteum]